MNKIFNLYLGLTFRVDILFCTLGLLFMLLSQIGWAQDPIFSRFTANPQSDNPAFAGATQNTQVYAVYRNQFPSLTTHFVTYAVGGSTYFEDMKSGVGLGLLYDDSADGLYITAVAKVNYAYKLELGGGLFLNAGLSLGVGRTQVDFDRLIFFDQIDPVLGPIAPNGLPFPTSELLPAQESVTYMDLGAGLLFYSNRLYVGIGFEHLNNPNNDFLVSEGGTSPGADGLPLRWTANMSYTIPLLESSREIIISVHPSLLYSRQRDFGQLNLGGYLKYKAFDIGASMRLAGSTNDALILSAGFGKEAYKIYYAYDFTTSNLASATGGAHEVGLTYRFGPEKRLEVECFDLYK